MEHRLLLLSAIWSFDCMSFCKMPSVVVERVVMVNVRALLKVLGLRTKNVIDHNLVKSLFIELHDTTITTFTFTTITCL